MTEPEMREYLLTLSPECRTLYNIAEAIVRLASDTLHDDFQIASEVMATFERRAKGGEE